MSKTYDIIKKSNGPAGGVYQGLYVLQVTHTYDLVASTSDVTLMAVKNKLEEK